MGADKQKQNMRFQITSRRLQNKVRYDNFTADEVKLIKAQKNFERYDKELNQFWATAPRNSCNNNVDWESMSEKELDYFEYINGEREKQIKQILKLEEKGLDTDKIMNLFMKLNLKSASF